ncbi:hypothetical protein MHBO_003253 [Bonamia ostreae]|uniref:Phospholipase D-like domain-containing protein n=1 Tax=Bonamia ostreae TaxID=126728 RepID=A0ABV2APY0_9EUKA
MYMKNGNIEKTMSLLNNSKKVEDVIKFERILEKNKEFEKLALFQLKSGKLEKAFDNFLLSKNLNKAFEIIKETKTENIEKLVRETKKEYYFQRKNIETKRKRYKDLIKRLRSIRFLRQNNFLGNISEVDNKSVISGSTNFTWNTVSSFSIVTETDFNNTGDGVERKKKKFGKSRKIKFVIFHILNRAILRQNDFYYPIWQN